MVYTLPKKMEILTRTFSASNPVEWINLEDGSIMEARAFDKDSKTPIPVGQERGYENKIFVYTPVSATHIEDAFGKMGWEKFAVEVSELLGCPVDIETFKKVAMDMMDSGSRRIVMLSLANKLGQKDCAGNKLLFFHSGFPKEKMDWDQHDQSWNRYLQRVKSVWRVKSPRIYITRIRERA